MVDVGEDAGACEASEFFGSASPDLPSPPLNLSRDGTLLSL
jgi:hypothetical protein